MIIDPRSGRASRAAAMVLVALALSACAGAPASGKRPVSAWQCPDGSVDLAGNDIVADAYRVQPGRGVPVRGLDGWEGEIMGRPAPGSGFSKLLIGMRPSDVAQRLGPPSDYGSYESRTDRDRAPYHFGSDRARYEMVYRGQGRLVFTTRSMFGPGRYLTWIIHDPSETSARR